MTSLWSILQQEKLRSRQQCRVAPPAEILSYVLQHVIPTCKQRKKRPASPERAESTEDLERLRHQLTQANAEIEKLKKHCSDLEAQLASGRAQAATAPSITLERADISTNPRIQDASVPASPGISAEDFSDFRFEFTPVGTPIPADEIGAGTAAGMEAHPDPEEDFTDFRFELTPVGTPIPADETGAGTAAEMEEHPDPEKALEQLLPNDMEWALWMAAVGSGNCLPCRDSTADVLTTTGNAPSGPTGMSPSLPMHQATAQLWHDYMVALNPENLMPPSSPS